MAATILSALPAPAAPAPTDSAVSGSFLDLVGQLLQLTKVEAQPGETAPQVSNDDAPTQASAKEEPEAKKRKSKSKTATVPVWSTIPVERTVLPWTLTLEGAPAQTQDAAAPKQQAMASAESAAPAPEAAKTQTPAAPVAFVAEIEIGCAPAPAPIFSAPVVTRPEIQAPAQLLPTAPPLGAVCPGTPQPLPQAMPIPPTEARERVTAAAKDTSEKQRSTEPAKIEAARSQAPPAEHEKAPAVEAVREEQAAPRDHDSAGSNQPASVPVKKPQKTQAGPEAAIAAPPETHAVAFNSGAPARDKVAAPQVAPSAPDSPETPAAARIQAAEKAEPAVRPEPVRDIAMRVSDESAQPVDIRLSERAGKVEVTVRTQDPGLRTAMQSDISHLVGRLESDGSHAKIWTPTGPDAVSRLSESAASSNDQPHDAPNHRGSQDESGGQRRQQQREPERDWLEEFERNRNGGKK